jgi:hypothetical protein
MPNLSKELIHKLDLKPGDIIISEDPFEDAVLTDYTSSKPMRNFKVTHVSVYTGIFDRPFAHSLREGHKLPGVRLTKPWDGRHIVYRMKDPIIAAKAAEIARRWAISIQFYDYELFNITYPPKTWDKQHTYYSSEYFSLPNAVVPGPATPYDLDRANLQISLRARNINLINFSDASLLRAVKFASRSDMFAGISNGLRCTSFVIDVYQAATLSPIVKKVSCKFALKFLSEKSIEAALDSLLIDNWRATELGSKILAGSQEGKYENIFSSAMKLDCKYAIPSDLHKGLKSSAQWSEVGYYSIHNSELVTLAKKLTEDVITTPPVILFKKPQSSSAPNSPEKSDTTSEQKNYADLTQTTMKNLGTPPRPKHEGSPRQNILSSTVPRRLFDD